MSPVSEYFDADESGFRYTPSSSVSLGAPYVKTQLGPGGRGKLGLALAAELDRIVAIRVFYVALVSDQQPLLIPQGTMPHG
jgi:hypothetical protein